MDWIDYNGHTNYQRLNIVPPRRSDYMLPLLANAWDNGIVTVVTAGNTPWSRLGERSPQRYGREDNALITVGSMDEHGRISPWNTPEGPVSVVEDFALVGSTTVYAQGERVKTAKPYGTYHYIDECSFAAPQVAGLAAYLAGLPGSRTLNSMEMKQRILSLSRWHGAIDGAGLIYNGVREQACQAFAASNSRRRVNEASVLEEMEEKIAHRALIAPPAILLHPPKKPDPPAHDPVQSSIPKVPSPPSEGIPPLFPNPDEHTCKRANIVRQ